MKCIQSVENIHNLYNDLYVYILLQYNVMKFLWNADEMQSLKVLMNLKNKVQWSFCNL